MKQRLLYSVHIWGPAVLSVLSLFWLVVYSNKVSRLEGQISALQHQIDSRAEFENGLRNETSALRAWAIAVHERGSAAGWKLPNLPLTPIIDQDTKHKKNKKQKEQQ